MSAQPPFEMPEPSRGSLPEPVVPAALYDEAYYREANHGFEEWNASEGAQLAGIYPGVLKLARFRPGEVLVDLGTGRGEMLAVAVQQGAGRAIGVEYSPAAVAMTHKTLEKQGIVERAEIILGDVRSIPIPDAIADLVTMIEVVEHLSPVELHLALVEARRILKPGGRIFAHTMPNRLIYTFTYRVLRLLRPRWPADPRNDYERTMHVNEQSARSLRNALRRAGFGDIHVRLGDWIYDDFLPDAWAKALYRRASRLRLLRPLVVGDLFADAAKR